MKEYLDILQRRWQVLLLALLLTVGTTVVASYVMAPVYRAAATVAPDRSPPVVMPQRPGDALFREQAEAQLIDVPTLVELARSESVRDRAIAAVKPLVGEQRAAAILRKGLRVQQVRSSQLVSASIDHTDPEIAIAALEAVLGNLVDLTRDARRRRAAQTREFIARQLATEREELRASEQALVAFKNQYGYISLAEETTLTLQGLAALKVRRVELDIQRQDVLGRVAGGRAALLAQPRITPNQWTGSPQITALRNRLAESEIELAGMRRALTAKHPAVISAMARIDETIRRLDAEVGKGLQPQVYGVDPVYQQLALQVKDADLARAALVPRERALEAAIQRYEERLRSLPPREAELAGLTRRVREAESLTLLLTGKLQEASTLEASIGSTVAVVDSPKVLDKPVRPQRPLYAGLAALVGLMIGIAGVYAAEQIDDRFHSVADVERSLGPVVATVPQLTDGQSPDIPLTMTLHDRHGAPFAEAFRHLRTRILVSRYPPLRTILVTSPGPGEGKDSVAANLAIALSQAGRRVWLVECDLRRPALARAFHADVTVGLADLLMNGLPVEQALLRTSVENLWLLPSGPPPTNPAELLAGPKMRSLLVPGNAEDFVIIDATPTLPVADAAELAAVTDGILLVVRLGKTPKAAARRALQELEVVGGRVVGIVVNGVSTRNPHGYDYTPYYPFGQTPRGALRHS